MAWMLFPVISSSYTTRRIGFFIALFFSIMTFSTAFFGAANVRARIPQSSIFLFVIGPLIATVFRCILPQQTLTKGLTPLEINILWFYNSYDLAKINYSRLFCTEFEITRRARLRIRFTSTTYCCWLWTSRILSYRTLNFEQVL